MKGKKTRVLSLVLSVVMLIGLMTAGTVSADAGKAEYVLKNELNSEADMNGLSWYGKGPHEFVADGGTSDGAVKFTYSSDEGRIFNISDVTFRKGATYTYKFRMKSSAPLNAKIMIDFYGANILLHDNTVQQLTNNLFSVTSEYQDFTYTFTIDDFVNSPDDRTSKGIDTYTTAFMFESTDWEAGNELWIDSISMTETLLDPNGENVVYENRFDSATDVSRLDNDWSPVIFDATGGFDGGAAKYTIDPVGRIFNVPGLTWKKGGTYTVSLRAKASQEANGNQAMIDFSGGPALFADGQVATYPSLYPNISTTWQKYSLTFTIVDFVVSDNNLTSKGIDSLVSAILFNGNGLHVGDNLWIDDIVITEKMPIDLTVAKTGDYEVVKANWNGKSYVPVAGELFDYYAMRFLFALNVGDNAKLSDVKNYGAYMIPWDKLISGKAIDDDAQTSGCAFYDAEAYPITEAQSTFTVDMLGIPTTAKSRTLYVVPFVNGEANVDQAYNEEISE